MPGKPCKPNCQCGRHFRKPESIRLSVVMLKMTNEAKRAAGVPIGSLPCKPGCTCRKHIPRRERTHA